MTATPCPPSREQLLSPLVPASAPLRVLADHALLRRTTAFMDGVPHLVRQFAQHAAATYTVAAATNYKFPQKLGFLPHAAIAANDQRVLEMLFDLQRSSRYRWRDKLFFAQTMRCAVHFGRLEMLQWLHRALGADLSWTTEPELLLHAVLSDHLRADMVHWLFAHCSDESLRLHDAWDTDDQVDRGDLAVIQSLHAHNVPFDGAAIERAAERGHLDVVRFFHFHDTGVADCSTNAMDRAAANGHLDVVRFLHEHRTEGCSTDAMDSAAANGHLAVVCFLHERRTEGCTDAALRSAADNGHLEVAQYLYAVVRARGVGAALDAAASSGHVDVVTCLHFATVAASDEHDSVRCSAAAMDDDRAWGAFFEHVAHEFERDFRGLELSRLEQYDRLQDMPNLPLHTTELMSKAVPREREPDADASSRHLAIVQFLHVNRSEGCTSRAMDTAARRGHLDVVRFLHTHRSEGCSTDAMDHAAWRGHLDVVQFLHAHRSEGCTTDAMDYAAREGHLDVVRFLHEHRSEGCTHAAMRHAIKQNHLDVAQFLHEHRSEGCYPSRSAVDARAAADSSAADGGGRYPVSLGSDDGDHGDHGCESDLKRIEIMDEVAERGHMALLAFLHERRHERCTTEAMDRAAANGHLAVVQYLHANRTEGCTASAMDRAAAHGHLDVVRFLHNHRTEGCSADAMDLAAAHGHIEVVQFLHTHRSEGCTTRAMDEAAFYGHLDVVRFLHTHRSEGCSDVALIDARSLETTRYLWEANAFEQQWDSRRALCVAAAHSTPEVFELLFQHRREGDAAAALAAAIKPDDWCVEENRRDIAAFICLQEPAAWSHTPSLLRDAIATSCSPAIVRVLCAYSTSGCLYDARAVAMQNEREGIVRVLDSFLSLSADRSSCSLEQHASDGRRRRCQRPQREWRL